MYISASCFTRLLWLLSRLIKRVIGYLLFRFFKDIFQFLVSDSRLECIFAN